MLRCTEREENGILLQARPSPVSSTLAYLHSSLQSDQAVVSFWKIYCTNTASQIKISRLKQLNISLKEDKNPSNHFSSWQVLKACAGSLEDFIFAPPLYLLYDEDPSGLVQIYTEPIDLGLLPHLRKLCLHIEVRYDNRSRRFNDHVSWCNKLLWNFSGPLENLEEIAIVLICPKETKQFIPVLKALTINDLFSSIKPELFRESSLIQSLASTGISVQILNEYFFPHGGNPGMDVRWLALAEA
ncbi:hypothetical protein CPB83DRAFT_493658 [Crepidotus variabilis]|uniref:Uncharacterized protein n=1 Tax=Crepidotus variabilis TaxID=179855 RepID=A0A9P6EBF4_9AGAR|nr:hypothetical protein CPB83DRAFT_493658 [Crepidotus variabilis]